MSKVNGQPTKKNKSENIGLRYAEEVLKKVSSTIQFVQTRRNRSHVDKNP